MKIISRKEALANGVVTYFTGAACIHGHTGPRQTSNKTCVTCSRLAVKRIFSQTPELWRANTKRWRLANHDRALADRRNYKARKRAAVGTHTANDIAEIIRQQRSRCGYCRKKLGRGFHVDHIKPLSRGGANDRTNLQVLCRNCNTAKHSKDAIDFAQSRGMLL